MPAPSEQTIIHTCRQKLVNTYDDLYSISRETVDISRTCHTMNIF